MSSSQGPMLPGSVSHKKKHHWGKTNTWLTSPDVSHTNDFYQIVIFVICIYCSNVTAKLHDTLHVAGPSSITTPISDNALMVHLISSIWYHFPCSRDGSWIWAWREMSFWNTWTMIWKNPDEKRQSPCSKWFNHEAWNHSYQDSSTRHFMRLHLCGKNLAAQGFFHDSTSFVQHCWSLLTCYVSTHIESWLFLQNEACYPASIRQVKRQRFACELAVK